MEVEFWPNCEQVHKFVSQLYELWNNLKQRWVEFHLTIVGIGRLGICAAVIFDRKGYNVLGVDVIPDYCEKINNRTLQSHEPLLTEYLSQSKNLKATSSLDEGLEFSDYIFILVDTPTGVAEKSYDHSKLSRVLEQIVRFRIFRNDITNILC